MEPYRSMEEFERNHPLWRYSPYLCGRINLLMSLRIEILQSLDEGIGPVVNIELVGRAEELLWLWLLGAYEMVRTMCQSKLCFSMRAHQALTDLKRELATARMPSAKMESQGKPIPITSNRSPAGIDTQNKDLLVGDPDHPQSGRALLGRFYTVLSSLAPDDVLKTHDASYSSAS